MRIRVDTEACVGHGRCYTLGPDVFAADDSGHCQVLLTEVPAAGELERQAQAGAHNCPEGAITIEDD